MSDALRIKGGVAVITGAASGIGTGLARKALAEGMRVVLADIQADQLQEFAATLTGEVLAVPTDVASAASVQTLAQKAYAAFGSVDLLFNNAGVMATGFSWEIEPERWARSLDVNIKGIMHGIHAFVPRMLEAGRPAHIVNTASIGGFLPSPLMAPYSATKAAAVAMTESLQTELRMINAPIGVSLLAPGPVTSAIFQDPFGKTTGPAEEKFVAMLRDMLTSNGMSPDTLADFVFAGIRNGDYWLLPHPEAVDEPLKQRTDMILGRRAPAPLGM